MKPRRDSPKHRFGLLFAVLAGCCSGLWPVLVGLRPAPLGGRAFAEAPCSGVGVRAVRSSLVVALGLRPLLLLVRVTMGSSLGLDGAERG